MIGKGNTVAGGDSLHSVEADTNFCSESTGPPIRAIPHTSGARAGAPIPEVGARGPVNAASSTSERAACRFEKITSEKSAPLYVRDYTAGGNDSEDTTTLICTGDKILDEYAKQFSNSSIEALRNACRKYGLEDSPHRYDLILSLCRRIKNKSKS